MCILCDRGRPQAHVTSRRNFLTGTAATGLAAGAMGLFGSSAAEAQGHSVNPPPHTGRPGRRYVIRNGHVMTMDPLMPNGGEFVNADVLVEGRKIMAVGPNLHVGNATDIDARGRVVMPGFVDTHHHQAWTAIRSSIPDSILIDDNTGSPSAQQNYLGNILLGFAPKYRPQDVYISELFGGLAQLDNGVTTVHDVSQIHHSPQHSDAAIQALFDTGRRAAFGYFESAGAAFGVPDNADNQYPTDATRIRNQWFSSSDQLVHMIMGVEIYLPNFELAWSIGRTLGLRLAAHILSPFGMRPIFDALANGHAGGADGVSGTLGLRPEDKHLFIHMTGMSDTGWNRAKQVGADVSIAFPIEMNMRHGIPPILKMQELGLEPSLSSDVETNLTADFFYQMRSAMNMQRMVVNQMILELGDFSPPNQYPVAPYPPNIPPLLNVRDVLRYATINGAKHLGLDHKTGSLTPGKEADIIILDGSHINVFPVNHVPGAVVQMMERTNVETVIVAGKIRKWKGRLLDVDLSRLRRDLERSRDFVYQAATGGPPNLFR
jgi:5-methylthioadenosine/S-adenosylhomocysteine deaminase